MAALDTFKTYLKTKQLVADKQLPYYLHWVERFQTFCEENPTLPTGDGQIAVFLQLLAKGKEEWQVKQAREAVRLFHFFLTQEQGGEKNRGTAPPDAQKGWQMLAHQMREALRLRHRSIRTEKSYLQWLRSFYTFLNGKAPSAINSSDAKAFLSHLAVDREVSASTQNQAFSALLFLFRHILDRDLDEISETVRAAGRRRLPVVLTKEQIKRICNHLDGVALLMARLIYGCGLRAQECVSLRIKDIDFERGSLTIRSGKGDKDRVTVLPESLKNDLLAHLAEIRETFEADIARDDIDGVWLPNALERKYPNAGMEWGWFWVFPASTISLDPRTNKRRRHHLHVAVLGICEVDVDPEPIRHAGRGERRPGRA